MLEPVLCITLYTRTVLGAGLCLPRHWSMDWTFGDPGYRATQNTQSDTGCLVSISTNCHTSDGHHASDGDQWNVLPAMTRGRLLAAPVAGARAEPALRAARRDQGAEQTETQCCQSQERTWSWHKTRLVSFPRVSVSVPVQWPDWPGLDILVVFPVISWASEGGHQQQVSEDTPAPAPREREREMTPPTHLDSVRAGMCETHCESV